MASNSHGLLLDTHAWLWAVADPLRLSPFVRKLLTEHSGPVYVSTASMMEIAIKVSIGKLQLADMDLARFATRANADSGIQLLEMSIKHISALQHLPWHHRDPFDRMIVSQAKEMGLTVVTRDPSFSLYGVHALWEKGR
jgi:PIN domain nuclease of toxin-antitoxin system